MYTIVAQEGRLTLIKQKNGISSYSLSNMQNNCMHQN